MWFVRSKSLSFVDAANCLQEVTNTMEKTVAKRKKAANKKKSVSEKSKKNPPNKRNKTYAFNEDHDSTEPIIIKSYKHGSWIKGVCECGSKFDLSNIENHVAKVHKRPYIVCPLERSFGRTNTMEKNHLTIGHVNSAAHDHHYAASNHTPTLTKNKDDLCSSLPADENDAYFKNDITHCSLCDYLASSEEELKNHVQNLHKRGAFICRFCKTHLNTISELTKHSCEVFDCSVCGKQMPVADLHNHLSQVHEVVLCKCGFVCNESEISNHQCVVGTSPPVSSSILPPTKNLQDCTPNKENIEQVLVCEACGFIAFSSIPFMKHKIKCGIACANSKELPPHKSGHVDESAIMNSSCEEVFDVSKFYCKFCSMCTNDFANYENHLLEHTNEVISYKCNLCRFTCKTLLCFKNHEIEHLNSYLCKFCKVQFQTRQRFYLHLKIHKPPFSFLCDLCSYRTCIKSNLDFHKKYHIGSDLFTCSYCSFVCQDESVFNVHLQGHSKKPKKSSKNLTVHICEKCSFSAEDEKTLKKHELMHMGFKTLYTCASCFYSSPKENEYEAHKRSHSGRTSTYLTCLQCTYTVNSQELYNKHVHTEQQYQCQLCSFSSDSQQTMEKHRLDMHKQTQMVKNQVNSPSADSLQTILNDNIETMKNHRKSHENVNSLDGNKSTSEIVTKNEHAMESRYDIDPADEVVTHETAINPPVHVVTLLEGVSILDEVDPKLGGSIYNCTMCSYTSEDAHDIKRHASGHYKQPVDQNKPKEVDDSENSIIICKYCNFTSTNLDSLKVHESNHRDTDLACNDKMNKCVSLKLKSKDSLSDTSIFNCSYCLYTTDNSQDIKRHLEGHEALQSHKKYRKLHHKHTVVDNVAIDKTNKLLKEKLQSNVIPESNSIYNCSQCSYTTENVLDIRRHALAHVNGGVVDKKKEAFSLMVCGQCNFYTNDQQLWKAHESSHQDDIKTHPTLYCDQCDFKTHHKGSLTLHVRKFHTPKLLFQCSSCSFTCSTEEIREHVHLVHNISMSNLDKYILPVFL